MKRKLLVIPILLAVLLLAGAGVYLANKKPGVNDSEKTLYTCGMHPQIIKDKPGNCPICGMKLVPVRKQASGTAKTGEP